jgi:hypothetical protein
MQTIDWAANLEVLDQLLQLLSQAPPTEQAAVRAHENLSAARVDLLGAMPVEYRMSLDLARDAAGEIQDAGLRQKSTELLDRLREPR